MSAGGVVLFCRMQAGQLVRVKSPAVDDYDPKTRAVGFVAGMRRLAELVLERSEKKFTAFKV